MRTTDAATWWACGLMIGALACGGCTTPAERDFAAADVRVLSLYAAHAQPAVEAYCDALAAQGHEADATQLRTDTRTLASEMRANCQARLDKLGAAAQAAAAARSALNVATAVLEAYQAQPAAATQPAAE